MRPLQNKLFSLFCLSTVIGIWPRFVEPYLLTTTEIAVKLPQLKRELRIVELSDIHVGEHTSDRFLKRVLNHVESLKPDLIALGGDYLCYGRMERKESLKNFLKALHAPMGVFAIFGNHDYLGGITVDGNGDYALAESVSTVSKGFKLLFRKQKLSGKISRAAKEAPVHPELLALFQECGIKVLENSTIVLPGTANLTGVAEYMSGKIDKELAFRGYDPSLPGILLTHNPDSLPSLANAPSELVLCGHTHGGQVNLPWFRDRFTLMEFPRYFTGLIKEAKRTIFISRGLSGVMPFRFFSPPQVVLVRCLPEEAS